MLRSADLGRPERPFRLLAGTAFAAAIGLLIVALFWAILSAARARAGGEVHLDVGYVLYITTLQAGLSTALSLAVGIALAWALNRLRFPGREVVVGLFASAIVTPGLVVAFGLIDVWGRAGWLGGLGVPIFGLGGVVGAHLVLDGAFAARILLGRLDAIPEARLKTGQSLGLNAWRRFGVIDWPAIRGSLPGLAAIIFLLAFTSFPIVLLLGGGPSVPTLEVAIYSAVRLDFDLNAAVTLALIQIGLCAVIIVASSALAPVATSVARSGQPRWQDAGAARAAQWIVLAFALFGFGAPLAAVIADGAVSVPDVLAESSFWSSMCTSLWIALGSSVLSLIVALAVAAASAAAPGRALRTLVAVPAYAYLAVPAVALSLGAFLLVRDSGLQPETTAPLVVVLANALLALPFAVATLGPPFEAIARSRGRLIRALSLGGVRQFTLIEWPLVARDAGLAFALSFCFSLGDLGVIALFGTQNFATLPLQMVRALGAYRSHEAAAIAALMLVLTIGAFVAIPKLFGRLGDAGA
ncbi:MAG TPA: hypothetical protein VHA07_11850 [Devosia sp.]|nr:hypothetical protein [Devosia sp.]